VSFDREIQLKQVTRLGQVDRIEKFANPVYSISVAILLRLKDFPKLGTSNPFFDTLGSNCRPLVQGVSPSLSRLVRPRIGLILNKFAVQ
jgi:hypothetical protein